MNVLVQYSKYLKMMTCPNKCLDTRIFKLSIQNGRFWFVCENRFYGFKNPPQMFSSISRIYSWYVTNAINDPCQHLVWFINSRIVIFRVFALSIITNKLLEQFRSNHYHIIRYSNPTGVIYNKIYLLHDLQKSTYDMIMRPFPLLPFCKEQ